MIKNSSAVFIGLCCLFIGFCASAATTTTSKEEGNTKSPVEQTEKVENQMPAQTTNVNSPCLGCHEDPHLLSILQTKHAALADKRTPFAKDACQSCHGDSTEHMNSGGADQTPSIMFGAKAKTPVAEQNKVCLQCHQSGARMEWKGSAHDTAGLACASCHVVHTPKDKVRDKQAQPEVCFNCHKTQRAQIHRFSSHPIKEGKLGCAECHNAHGGAGPKLLNKPTLNEVCYTCHAEKRGPFLWEHQPVREDCSICHSSHGSNHRPLLNARDPWLCQRCHMENFHPSAAYDGINRPTTSLDAHTLGKNCQNCHVHVHGSNHPSGVRKTR